MHPRTGRVMEVLTDQPGIQFYTANYLASWNYTSPAGGNHQQYAGFCLEAQTYPDALHHLVSRRCDERGCCA